MSEAPNKTVSPKTELPRPVFYWTLSAGLALLVLFLASQRSLPCPASAVILVVGAFVCALTDIWYGKIFNNVVLPLLLVVLGMNIMVDWILPQQQAAWGTIGLGGSVGGIGVCFLAMLFPYSLGEIGAGDVKLAMLTGATIGAQEGLVTLCVAVILAAVWGILLVLYRYGIMMLYVVFLRALTELLQSREEKRKKGRLAIPLAPMFFLAILATRFGDWEQWIRQIIQ